MAVFVASSSYPSTCDMLLREPTIAVLHDVFSTFSTTTVFAHKKHLFQTITLDSSRAVNAFLANELQAVVAAMMILCSLRAVTR